MKTAARKSGHESGFATFTAVVMITMVSLALLSLTALFQTDTKRSMRHGAELQLRQYLIAGAVAANAEAEKWPTSDVELIVTLPGDLEADVVAHITFESAGSDSLKATVTAMFDEYKAIQVLSFKPAGTGWALKDAQIIRPY